MDVENRRSVRQGGQGTILDLPSGIVQGAVMAGSKPTKALRLVTVTQWCDNCTLNDHFAGSMVEGSLGGS